MIQNQAKPRLITKKSFTGAEKQKGANHILNPKIELFLGHTCKQNNNFKSSFLLVTPENKSIILNKAPY